MSEGAIMEISRRPLLVILFTYLGFVVYGSLIPFRFRQISLEEAWIQFCHIPYLQLGIASRADWVANILLYLLLSYLSALWLIDREEQTETKWFKFMIILSGCFFLAVSIEFVQIFFSPRTVSLNDLIAETLGTIAGLALWGGVGGRVSLLWKDILSNGPRALVAALLLFTFGYLTLCLFPFDFLVSSDELAAKLSGPLCGFFQAEASQQGIIRVLFRFSSELLLAIPFGLFFAMRKRAVNNMLLSALIFGGILGLTIETLQLFVASGVSQGVSVVSRITGFGLGLYLHKWAQAGILSVPRRYIRPVIFAGLVPYLLAVLQLSGWLTTDWVGIKSGLAKFDGQMLLPFYYHYFSTETQAVLSVFFNVALYLPVGFCFWAWNYSLQQRGRTVVAVWAGGVFSFFIETGKLFIVGKHPDFTNVFLAVGAVFFSYWLLDWCLKLSSVLTCNFTSKASAIVEEL